MPRVAVEDNNRMSLRIPAAEKAILLRAAALKHTDLSEFVRQHSVDAAKAVIREEEHTVTEEYREGFHRKVVHEPVFLSAEDGNRSRTQVHVVFDASREVHA